MRTLALLCLLAVAHTASAQPKKYALLVGVNKYGVEKGTFYISPARGGKVGCPLFLPPIFLPRIQAS